ncbi:MAG: hypothetical protein KKA84_02920 [Bacteroidetes bacterium]|nr:hypothetical protein [Bacteroidota bacterium]
MCTEVEALVEYSAEDFRCVEDVYDDAEWLESQYQKDSSDEDDSDDEDEDFDESDDLGEDSDDNW